MKLNKLYLQRVKFHFKKEIVDFLYYNSQLVSLPCHRCEIRVKCVARSISCDIR